MRQLDQKRMINLFRDFYFVLEWEEFFFLNLNFIFSFLFWRIGMTVLIIEQFLDELDGVKLAIGVASGEVDFAEAPDG